MKIDLGAPEGNAIELGGITYRVARQCGLSEKAAKDILSDMRAGTYIDLLNVMDREFPGLFQFHGDPRVKR
ncbi:hypothetical protein ACFPOE_01950 [Caenimonas terrae]|uniref:Uncharacterized protein n=1 Tax=Caenimonas terrae TaxID=696074 RepID=A0ABW0N8H7_9BURK